MLQQERCRGYSCALTASHLQQAVCAAAAVAASAATAGHSLDGELWAENQSGSARGLAHLYSAAALNSVPRETAGGWLRPLLLESGAATTTAATATATAAPTAKTSLVRNKTGL